MCLINWKLSAYPACVYIESKLTAIHTWHPNAKWHIFTHPCSYRIGLVIDFWNLTQGMDRTLFWLFHLNTLSCIKFKLELCCSPHFKNLTRQTFSAMITLLCSVYYISGHSHECDFRLQHRMALVHSG